MNTVDETNVTFILIDDEDDGKIVPLIMKLIGEAPGLKIDRQELFREGSEDALSALVQGLARPSGVREYGLLLDLRLDGVTQRNGRKFPSYGTSIAQEIRTRETFTGVDWCFPIVLLSMETVFAKGYQRDRTGRDLFDLAEKKERLPDLGVAKEFASRLVSLAKGYAQLREWAPAADGIDLLGELPKGAYIGPEIRRELGGARPRHDLAQFLIRGLLETPGPLISRDYVLARLGVELSDSGQHGTDLLSVLSDFSYRGIFASGWPRWWSGAIEQWWAASFPRERPLRMLTAEQRVGLLATKLGLTNLRAAVPIQEDYGTRYWIACAATRRPLDPLDAVKIDGPVPSPWQEHRHVHLQAAIRSTDLPVGMVIHPSEDARIERLRETEESQEQNKGW